jgi:hypothetical protein
LTGVVDWTGEVTISCPVHADLGDDLLGGAHADTGDLIQLGHRRRERGDIGYVHQTDIARTVETGQSKKYLNFRIFSAIVTGSIE